MKTLEDILIESEGSMITIKKGSLIKEANRLAKYVGSDAKIKRQDDDVKSSSVDSTSGDSTVTYKTPWYKIGNHEVRTIGREIKFPVKSKSGTIPIKRHYHSIEIKDNSGITEYKVSAGTGQKVTSYKIFKPELNSLINKVSNQLGIPKNKTLSLFNMTTDDIKKQVHGYKEIKQTEDGEEQEIWHEGNPEYSSLKALNNRDINIIRSKLKIPESISKSDFESTIANRLNIDNEDSAKLTEFGGTPKGIRQKEGLSDEEQQSRQQSSIAAQLDMLDEIKELMKDPETSDLDKQENFGQARTIEMRLEKQGISITDPISNYYTPTRTGPSSMASGFAKSRDDSTITQADPEKVKQIQAARPREESPLEKLKKQLITKRGMSEEEAEAKAKDLIAKNPNAVFFPEHKLIEEIDKFLLG